MSSPFNTGVTCEGRADVLPTRSRVDMIPCVLAAFAHVLSSPDVPGTTAAVSADHSPRAWHPLVVSANYSTAPPAPC